MIKIIKKSKYIILCFYNFKSLFLINGVVEHMAISYNDIEKQLITLKKQRPMEKSLFLVSHQLLSMNKDKTNQIWKSIKDNYSPMSYVFYINSYSTQRHNNKNNKYQNKDRFISNQFGSLNGKKNIYNKTPRDKMKQEEYFFKQMESNVIDVLKLIGVSSIDKKVFLPIMKNNRFNPLIINDVLIYINNSIRLEVWLLLFIIYLGYKSDVKRVIIMSEQYPGFNKEFFLFLGDITLIFVEVNNKDKKKEDKKDGYINKNKKENDNINK